MRGHDASFEQGAGQRVLARNLGVLPVFSLFTYPFACVPVLYFFMRDRGIDKGEFAALQSIYYIGMAVFELPTGWFTDRFGRKLSLVLGPLLLAAGFFSIFRAHRFAEFAVGELLFAMGHATLSGPPSALLFESLLGVGRETEYLRQESRMSGWRGLGTACAFLAGGIAGSLFGLSAAVLLTSILCGFAFVAALFVHEPVRTSPLARGSGHAAPRRLLDVFRQSEVAWLLAYYVLLFFLMRYGFHTLQPWLERSKTEDPLFIGTLTFFCALVAYPFTRKAYLLGNWLGEVIALLTLPVLVSFALLGMSLGTSLGLLPFFLLLQIPFGIHWPIVHSYANHRIPSRDRALSLSALSFSGRVGFAAGFPLVFHAGSKVENDYLPVGLACITLCLVLAVVRPRGQASARVEGREQ